MTTTIYGDVGQAFTAEVVQGNTFYVNAPEPVPTRDLSADEVRRYRAGFVRPDGWAHALEVLHARKLLTLLGPEGSGRRTAAVNLIAARGLTAIRELLLEEDQANRLPSPEQGYGYLLDLGGIEVDARLGARLRDYAERLRAAGSVLVVLATEEAWHALDWTDAEVAVRLPAPPGLEILRHRLASRSLDPTPWCRDSRIAEALMHAPPKDAVRLARIIAAETERTGTTAKAVDDTAVEEVLDAYANWTRHLKSWFGDQANEDGMARAVLLAAAVLEGCSATSTLRAADLLARRLELPTPPGKGLIGPGGAHLLEQAGATIDSGVVRFSRLEFARAVLDFVWQDRPVLQGELAEWLVELPLNLPEAGAAAARTVAWLAIRHRRTDLVPLAARRWWEKTASHDSAVELVTRTGIDDRIGRETRRWLYDTARSSENDLHALVVAVCGGRLGRRFPQVALTRLKHVAARTPERHEDVVDAVVSLVRDADRPTDLLAQVVAWSASESRVLRRAGTLAFLALVRVEDVHTPSLAVRLREIGRDETRLLARGWQAALRESSTVPTATTSTDDVAASWLEAALRGPANRELVVEILASACRSMRDLGRLTETVDRWRFDSDDPAAPDRKTLADELLRRAQTSVVRQLDIPLAEPNERNSSS